MRFSIAGGAMDLKGLTAAKVAPTDDAAEASARPLTSQVLAHLVKLLRNELRHERGTTEHLDDAIGPVAVHDGAGTHWFWAARGGVNTPQAVGRNVAHWFWAARGGVKTPRAVGRNVAGPSRPVLAAMTRLHFRPVVVDGAEPLHLPITGGGNTAAFIDSCFLAAAIERRLHAPRSSAVGSGKHPLR